LLEISGGEKMKGKIHPIIIYPFTDPYDASDSKSRFGFKPRFGRRNLEYLYTELAAFIKQNPQDFEKPITVVNRQTINRSKRASDIETSFQKAERTLVSSTINGSKGASDIETSLQKAERTLVSSTINGSKGASDIETFINNFIQEDMKSEVIKAWCVDSCQMWLTGLGAAFVETRNRQEEGDVFWLIPADYYYNKYAEDNENRHIINEMMKLPRLVLDTECCLTIGEIDVDKNSSKQLIDTYGTYALLANWFPHEAKRIRKITLKPRTEFLAISRSFLRDLLDKRWYAYEQTIVILLQCLIGGRNFEKVSLGKIADAAQGRDSLSVAMQQLERTERVLKLFWREQNQDNPLWIDTFQKLDTQSEQIRSAALITLENLL
jgi:hypothetical protein